MAVLPARPGRPQDKAKVEVGVHDSVDVNKRQVCWAHLLRDFTRISERSGAAGQIGRRLLGLGCVMFRWRGRGCKNYEPLQRRLRTALQRGAA